MVGCVITGHGEFAAGVLSAFEMIAGSHDEFEAVTFREEEAEEYPARIAAAIAGMVERDGSCVVFCDLVGGTPFNQSMMVAARLPGVEVVAGANLPMLLECLMERGEESTAADIADMAVATGRDGICNRHLEWSKIPACGNAGEDGI